MTSQLGRETDVEYRVPGWAIGVIVGIGSLLLIVIALFIAYVGLIACSMRHNRRGTYDQTSPCAFVVDSSLVLPGQPEGRTAKYNIEHSQVRGGSQQGGKVGAVAVAVAEQATQAADHGRPVGPCL